MHFPLKQWGVPRWWCFLIEENKWSKQKLLWFAGRFVWLVFFLWLVTFGWIWWAVSIVASCHGVLMVNSWVQLVLVNVVSQRLLNDLDKAWISYSTNGFVFRTNPFNTLWCKILPKTMSQTYQQSHGFSGSGIRNFFQFWNVGTFERVPHPQVYTI